MTVSDLGVLAFQGRERERERDGEEDIERCVEIDSERREERKSNGGVEAYLQRHFFLSQDHERSR